MRVSDLLWYRAMECRHSADTEFPMSSEWNIFSFVLSSDHWTCRDLWVSIKNYYTLTKQNCPSHIHLSRSIVGIPFISHWMISILHRRSCALQHLIKLFFEMWKLWRCKSKRGNYPTLKILFFFDERQMSSWIASPSDDTMEEQLRYYIYETPCALRLI